MFITPIQLFTDKKGLTFLDFSREYDCTYSIMFGWTNTKRGSLIISKSYRIAGYARYFYDLATQAAHSSLPTTFYINNTAYVDKKYLDNSLRKLKNASYEVVNVRC